MPTVRQLRTLLREQGQPTSGSKATLEARYSNWRLLADSLEEANLSTEGSTDEMKDRLKTPYKPTYAGEGIVADAGTRTCPNRTDPLSGELLEPGTFVYQLRNTNGTFGFCYTDRTMKNFTKTSTVTDGPFLEDMGSFSYPYPAVAGRGLFLDSSGLPTNGDVVVRKSSDKKNHVLVPFSACTGNPSIIAAYVRANRIPKKAFSMCTSLKYVNLPQSLKSIYPDAFQGCTLASLVIPAGLKMFGHQTDFSVKYITYLGKPEGRNVLRVPEDSTPAAVHIVGFIGGEVLKNSIFGDDLGFEPYYAHLVPNLDDLNVLGKDGTMLHTACIRNRPTLAKLLIKAGADVDKANGLTPLWDSSKRGRTALVEMLIEAGVNVNKGGTVDLIYFAPTPLYIASQMGHAKVVEMLLRAGADVNKAMYRDDGATPLYIASQMGHAKVVEMLLQAGADVNKATTAKGVTPLLIALRGHRLKVVKLLLDAGANSTTAFEVARDMGGVMAQLFSANSYAFPTRTVTLKQVAGSKLGLVIAEYDHMKRGIRIEEVMPEGAAGVAGIHTGDVLIEIDGTGVLAYDNYDDVLPMFRIPEGVESREISLVVAAGEDVDALDEEGLL